MISKKVILIGRHTSELPSDLEIVAQENITWATDARDCTEQWTALYGRARDAQAGILLQNVPGILAATLVRTHRGSVPVGIIISVPGERQAGVSREFDFEEGGALAERAVQFANGRAKTALDETENLMLRLTVTVDPVAAFSFSHIEWL